ncbi:putative AGC kinase [Sesbania bispinosa]|nr:putative AGC kinase [Sesbania bispinosa]
MAKHWLDPRKIVRREGCARRTGGSGDVVVTEILRHCGHGKAKGGVRWWSAVAVK